MLMSPRRIGFALALIAALGIFAHTPHAHTDRAGEQPTCFLCHTPSIGADVPHEPVAHAFTASALLIAAPTFAPPLPSRATASPRAPPAV